MPIYRGTQKIAKIYRGTQEIKSIYRGTQQVFKSGTPIHLFGDVYKAKYVKTKDNISAIVRFNFTAINNFDQYKRKYELYYRGNLPILWVQTAFCSAISKSSIRLGGTANAVELPKSDSITKVLIDRTSLYINDNFVSNLTIGGTLDSGTTQTIRVAPQGYKFYEIKIYDNDVLTYHFVPAYSKVNSVITYGIAEVIHQEFLPDGSVIGEPEYE